MSDVPFLVLVVDDHPQNVMLAEVHLKSIGCRVDKASDGLQCLAQVEREAPDLILLDVNMPKMDGFEVCRRLKNHKQYRHIPIVLLTALNASEDRVTGIEAGADDFISKPFNRHELIARVKSLLRVKRLEEAERLHMRRTFERYVDSAVAQQLMDNPDLIHPGGNRRDASIIFVDVRGFTAWSETRAPEEVVEVINLFLGTAVEAVFQHGGAVDKFTGDGLMAHFGAIILQPDHPRRAVAGALQIVQSASAVKHPALKYPLGVGCGVNSGELVIGNIGSDRRLDYTAIGDVVNVASRLTQEAAKGQVLVSEMTYRRLGGAVAEDLGPKFVKNRQEPIQAFAVSALQ
ncbi:MAG: response regulator [Opitutaceae bacterium]|nr:response regulator [Opitutaceae bacterium]